MVGGNIYKQNNIKTILDLNNKEIKKFFLQNKNYSNLLLPNYFDFTELLKQLDSVVDTNENNNYKKINNKNYDFPSFYNNVNYKLYINKNTNIS